jgi:2-isopropylmalate synthase
LWCDPAQVGATPAIGVNRQSGKANILLLSETLGVPLNSAQAQELMDTNQPMIEGGGFTASEVSFRLACLKALKALPNLFNVRTWRVFDESDEAGTRFVQAFMSLGIGEKTVVTTRAEGAGPVDAMTRAMRRELEKWYPALQQMRLGRFSVTAIDVSAHDSAAYVRVTVSFQADGHEPWVTAGVSSDMNQAALMAIVDGFHHWLLLQSGQPYITVGTTGLSRSARS